MRHRTTRRRAVAAVGAALGTAGCLGGVFDDGCPPAREPTWQIVGDFWSPPAVADNRVYVGEWYGASGVDRLSRIGCYGTGTGRAYWVHPVESGTGWPRRVGETVYVGTGDDRLLALDAATGRRRWTYDAGGREQYGGGAWARPVATDDRVVLAVSSSDDSDPSPSDPSEFTHRLVGLDRADGRVVWERSLARGVFEGMQLADGAAYAATEAGRLYRVDPADGSLAWTAELPGSIRRQPIVTGRAVVVGTESGQLVGLDRANGNSRWATELDGAVTALTTHDGRVVAGDETGRLVSRTGETTVWTETLDAPIAGVDGTDDQLWVLDQRGVLVEIDPASGEHRRALLVGPSSGDRCGWRAERRRRRGLAVESGRAIVTGPWVGRVRLVDRRA